VLSYDGMQIVHSRLQPLLLFTIYRIKKRTLHPHQLPRWQDRYAAAIAHASNTWDLLYRAAKALG